MRQIWRCSRFTAFGPEGYFEVKCSSYLYSVPVKKSASCRMFISPIRLLRFSKPNRALPSTYQYFSTCKLTNSSWTGFRKGYSTSVERLPRVAQPSLWQSLVPKAFRSPAEPKSPSKFGRSKEWNPATFFIFIFLLIGSNAIQMITLRHEYSAFSRKADAKIALLQDVLDRVQRGQDFDVEKALGTGDEVQEQEWKDGMSLLPNWTQTTKVVYAKLTILFVSAPQH